MSLTLGDLDNYTLADLDDFTLDELDAMTPETLAQKIDEKRFALQSVTNQNDEIPHEQQPVVIQVETLVIQYAPDTPKPLPKRVTYGVLNNLCALTINLLASEIYTQHRDEILSAVRLLITLLRELLQKSCA